MQKIFPRLVALFPLLLPLYLLKGDFFGLPLTFPELILGVLFLLFLFYQEEFSVSDLYERKVWPVILFLVGAVVSLFVVPKVSYMMDGSEFPAMVRALGIFKGWILAPILYFVIARSVFREKPSLIAFAMRAMLFSGACLSVYAIWQVVTDSFVTLDGRASGPFESANYLALYVGPLVVYGAMALVGEFSGGKVGWRVWHDNWRVWLERVALFLGTGLCAVALYFTDSYASFIAVTASLGVGFLVFLRRKNRKVFLASILGVLVLFAGLVLSQMGTDKFKQAMEFSERSSSSVRIQVYEISAYLIEKNPIFGIGLGQFEQKYQEVAETVLGELPYELNMLHPHNIFLAMWLSVGLLGLAGFVWMCFKALLWLTEADKKERSIVALMLVTVLVHGLFDTPYFKNDLAFQFWLMMAVLL